ncbi:serine/threonine-protein kinase Nek9-like [Mytilus trossulus]|uniref:serine/threonine-protein kinase Nek9-like n=1 Tax=Mytilus trossulus TaxID=6551 RepID=UPI0030055D09
MATDGQEVDSEIRNQDGALEASYIYVKVLGRGAFGEANLYRKTEDKSLVVWKEVNLARLHEKERRDALSEVDILSLLNHANIITYYNHFLDGETLLIEMEYANGGSLYHKIAEQTELFSEEVIRWYLFQLASALSHIHGHDIIHRDVKTLNIFMSKSSLLKLGDFGISKVLETESKMADSVVGTPYYMSPEIIQGEKYDHKTDIWALGCVLYELLTFKRVFQATNQLRLAYEIVKGDYEDINPQYSQEIKDLVKSTLQKKSKDRPSSEEILSSPIFTKENSNEDMKRKVWELNTQSRRLRLQSVASTETVPIIKSKSSEVYQWGGGKFTPQKQDIFTKGKSAVQVAVGNSHFAVVTMEKELYTWANVQGGTEIVGQLGQGNKSAYKAPQKVEGPTGAGFIQAACGEDFTLAVTDEGQVYASGSDYYGCLGVDNEEGDSVLSLIPINFFSSRPVEEISCGDNHCVALTKEGDVYTWGCGEFGRLGLNSEDDHFSPQKVKTPGKHLIKHVLGGSEGTFLITTTGRVLACGSNEHNILGFNSEMSGLRKRKQSYDIPCKYTFSTVKPLVRYNIVSIATSNTHSAAIDMFGHLLTFGSNKHGQLGVGDYRKRLHLVKIGGELTGKQVLNVACGDGYTVAATSDNEVYSWGNGENGRLGAKYDGKGPNSMCTAYPRPVFGSLHDVPNLAARHWHTIIIAAYPRPVFGSLHDVPNLAARHWHTIIIAGKCR